MRWKILVMLTSVLVSASGARAQSVPSCTYDQCALRLEGSRLIAGIDGRPVTRVGLFGARGLNPLMARSDSAAAYARHFQSRQATAGVLGIVGVALGIGYLATFDPFDDSSAGPNVALGVTSLVAAAASTIQQMRAQRALSRAVWWHNRELTR